MGQVVYINSLADSIKENYENLLRDTEAFLNQVEPLVPITHQGMDSPINWIKNLREKLEKKKRVFGSVKVSEKEFNQVSLDSALKASIQLVDDYNTVFSPLEDL